MDDIIICGLIGDPVKHSVSPILFNYYAKSVGLDKYYHIKFRIDKKIPGELRRVVEGIKAFSMRGFNITLPYKLDIMKYINKLDEKSKRIGAVNVILNKNRKIYGYNTDGLGFIKSFENEVRKIHNNDKVVIIGAGGASRAVCSEIYSRTKNLAIINIDSKEGVSLKRNLGSWGGKGVRFLNLNKSNLKRELVDANIVCNATSIGMFPNEKDCIIPNKIFKYLNKKRESLKGMIFCDVIFNPPKTKFLINAEKLGATVIGGVGMMAFQAAKAFHIWTGKRVSNETIKQAYKLVTHVLKDGK